MGVIDRAIRVGLWNVKLHNRWKPTRPVDHLATVPGGYRAARSVIEQKSGAKYFLITLIVKPLEPKTRRPRVTGGDTVVRSAGRVARLKTALRSRGNSVDRDAVGTGVGAGYQLHEHPVAVEVRGGISPDLQCSGIQKLNIVAKGSDPDKGFVPFRG